MHDHHPVGASPSRAGQRSQHELVFGKPPKPKNQTVPSDATRQYAIGMR